MLIDVLIIADDGSQQLERREVPDNYFEAAPEPEQEAAQ